MFTALDALTNLFNSGSALKRDHDIPVSRLENSFFEIVRLSDLDASMKRPNHRHDFFKILWFTSSSDAAHFIDFESYPAESGLIYLIAPGQVHAYEGLSGSGYAIVFSLDLFSSIQNPRLRLMFNPFMNRGIPSGSDEAGVLRQLAELMVLESGGKKDFFILLSYVEAFLRHIARMHSEASFVLTKAGERMGKLFALVDGSFRSERRSDFYASALGITPKRLNEILNERFGTTLTRILHRRLILEAKREVAYGRKSFKEIAFELGFSDQAYFSRFFKAQAGMMPADFRRTMASGPGGAMPKDAGGS
ncbi:helix-turn-helix domain-containing protein [Pelodictyon luteolum]|uniref:Transcriptional regulator, AraC family n=1 Tax=Chlorobium luteolum (strain DSM 273 / BCRC 81028 / 2530) TaxID=319225 RepID=Q3B4Q5_CHLL3|nr:helix-turn-helix domain-containing protein [Pelodictyon luteolum]ABB23676.1 transcriptional regulator, AraC family [Pelodictyon luteolum DSM 273]